MSRSTGARTNTRKGAEAPKGKHPTRGRKLARDLLEEKELSDLLAACGNGDSATRNKAMISVLSGTGIRISEALSLRPQDIDLKKRRVKMIVGQRYREVWLHPDAVPYIREWMKVRAELGLSECPVFCNMDGATIHSSYYRALFPKIGKAAGIKKRVYADGLRHILARRLFEAKATQRSIQLQFGHENITTTVALLERLGLHDGFEAFEAAFGK